MTVAAGIGAMGVASEVGQAITEATAAAEIANITRFMMLSLTESPLAERPSGRAGARLDHPISGH